MPIQDVTSLKDLTAVMKAPFRIPDPTKPADPSADPTNPDVQESFAYWSQRVNDCPEVKKSNEVIQFLIALNDLNNLSRPPANPVDVRAKTKAIIDKFIVVKPSRLSTLNPDNTPINLSSAQRKAFIDGFKSDASDADVLRVIESLNKVVVDDVITDESNIGNSFDRYIKAFSFEISPDTGEIIRAPDGTPIPAIRAEGALLRSDRRASDFANAMRRYFSGFDLKTQVVDEAYDFWRKDLNKYASALFDRVSTPPTSVGGVSVRVPPHVDADVVKNAIFLQRLEALNDTATKMAKKTNSLDEMNNLKVELMKIFDLHLSNEKAIYSYDVDVSVFRLDLPHVSPDALAALRKDAKALLSESPTMDSLTTILLEWNKTVAPEAIRALSETGYLGRYVESQCYKDAADKFESAKYDAGKSTPATRPHASRMVTSRPRAKHTGGGVLSIGAELAAELDELKDEEAAKPAPEVDSGIGSGSGYEDSSKKTDKKADHGSGK